MKLHAQILKKNGRNEFVVLPYEEYRALAERLADAEDTLALRRARRADKRRTPGLSLDELKAKLGLKASRAKRSARR
jgi:hypothetical protein